MLISMFLSFFFLYYSYCPLFLLHFARFLPSSMLPAVILFITKVWFNEYFFLLYLSLVFQHSLPLIFLLNLHTVFASPSQHSPHTYHSLPRSFRSRPQSNDGYTSILVPALIIGGIVIVAIVLFTIVGCVTKKSKKDDDDSPRRRTDRTSSDDAQQPDDNEGDDVPRNRNALRDEEEGRVSEGKKRKQRGKKGKRNKEEAVAEAEGEADDDDVNLEAEARLQLFKQGEVGPLSQSMDEDARAILESDTNKQTVDKARIAIIDENRQKVVQQKKNRRGDRRLFDSHKDQQKKANQAQKELQDNFTPLSINNPYQDKVAVTVPDHIEAVEQPEEEWADNKEIFSKMSEYVPQGMLDDDCDDF